ncbi:MAG: DUF6438 domain-containing protein [Flavobacteriales bacterium]
MKAILYCLTALFLTLGCSTAQLSYNKIESITLSKSGCYGKCPIYTVTFFDDNSIKYKGKMFVEHIGEFSAESPQDFSELQSLLQELDFFSLKESYLDSNIVDIPIHTLVVRQGKLTKRIVENGEAPYEVKRIGSYLDRQISKLEASDWFEINNK